MDRTPGSRFTLTRRPVHGVLPPMQQNPWTRLSNAIGGRREREPAPRPRQPNTVIRSEEQAQAEARANRQREMQRAIQRAQAARGSGTLSEREIAAIRSRYQ